MKVTTILMLWLTLQWAAGTWQVPAISPSTVAAQPVSTTNDELAHALHLLGSEHGDRQNGIQWLSDHPDISRAPLHAFLQRETSDWKQEGALKALAGMASIADLPLLDSLAMVPGNTNGLWTMMAIKSIPSPQAFEHLKYYANQSNEKLAGDALVAMGSSKYPEARKFLEGRLQDPNKTLRWKAVHGLMMMGPQESHAALKAQLGREKDKEVIAKIHAALRA